MTKKTLIPYHGDELVIQSDLYNICGHVAVSRIFLCPFESIRECLLLRCCLCFLSELVVFFECLFFICRIKFVTPPRETVVLQMLHVAVGLGLGSTFKIQLIVSLQQSDIGQSESVAPHNGGKY